MIEELVCIIISNANYPDVAINEIAEAIKDKTATPMVDAAIIESVITTYYLNNNDLDFIELLLQKKGINYLDQ